MVEALKKIDKKILILIVMMISLPVLVILILALVRGCSNSTVSYDDYEEKMISAAEKYFKDKDKLPTEESQIVSVKLKKLVDSNYIKSSEDLLDDSSCTGSVNVRLNGSVVEENNGGYFNYTVSLKCDNYETKTLKSEIMKSLTTSNSGLYNVNDNYIFKGEDVDNYVTFYGTDYRIISMDSNGVLKLLKVESESNYDCWDNKYNVEANDIVGKNIYQDSYILKQLLNIYNNSKTISKDAKTHIVSYDLCMDSRDVNDTSMQNPQCSNILNDQVISLVNVNDFANASIDPDCNSIISKSCRNYNYMKNLNLKTWTYVAVSNNTYEVFYLGNGVVKEQEASLYDNYHIVIYVDGNEKVIEGNGKEASPYIIK